MEQEKHIRQIKAATKEMCIISTSVGIPFGALVISLLAIQLYSGSRFLRYISVRKWSRTLLYVSVFLHVYLSIIVLRWSGITGLSRTEMGSPA